MRIDVLAFLVPAVVASILMSFDEPVYTIGGVLLCATFVAMVVYVVALRVRKGRKP